MSTIRIDAVVKQLDDAVAGARVRRDRLGWFAAMYRQTTKAVRAEVAAGRFGDADRMEDFVSRFAARYLGPLEGGTVPRSWQVAFDAARTTDAVILQHLLLGINAHINLDLPIVAAEVCPGEQIHSLHDDFIRINGVLSALMPRVRACIGRFSPLLDVIDRVGGAGDDEILHFSIRVARDESWRQAVTLASTADDARRAEMVDSLDRHVAVLSRLLVHPGGLMQRAVDIVAALESDDVAAVIDALGQVTPGSP